MQLIRTLLLLASDQERSAPMLASDTTSSDDENSTADILKWLFVVIELVLMSTLVVIASSFLHQSYKQEQKTAKFIIKLLILIDLVAISGILNSINEAPWWDKTFTNSIYSIIVQCVVEFVYWTGAQWSTWIIAFQFYSTAQQMKKVDEYFLGKLERRQGMTSEEIKEEKEKKQFLQRQKERLFEIVDHIDKIDPLLKKEDPTDAMDAEGSLEVTEESKMSSKVTLYRKRLNRWKNLGVWFVFLSVGAAMVSISIIRYKIEVMNISKSSGDLRTWIIVGLLFGGLNIVCQCSACWIMLSATMTMKKLASKNGFNQQNFQDIRKNNIVSLLICFGYVSDYASDIALTFLLLRNKITTKQEQFWEFANQVFLSICIFIAYIILLKIFLGYQKQVHEALAKKEEEKKKKKATAAKEEAKKQEQQLLSGETGVTPNQMDVEEQNPLTRISLTKMAKTVVNIGNQNLLKAVFPVPIIAENNFDKNEKSVVEVEVEVEEEDEKRGHSESFVTNALNLGLTTSRDRILSIATVQDVDSDSDSFKTDSSGDSILDSSFEDSDMDEQDKALQTQILQNFVKIYKKEGSKSLLMHQETRFEKYSPTNNRGDSVSKPPKQIVKTQVAINMINDETEDEFSDFDQSDNDQSDNDSALGNYMKPGLFRPSEKVVDYDDIQL